MVHTLKSIVKNSPIICNIIVPVYREYQIAMSGRPLQGSIPQFQGGQFSIPVHRSESLESYNEWLAISQDEILLQREVEKSLIPPGRARSFSVPGTCALCQRDTLYRCTYDYAIEGKDGRATPNLSETLKCKHCKLSSRMRGAFHVLIQEFRPQQNQNIYITEQFGRAFRWLSGRFPRSIGSEFFSPADEGGTIKRGIRHEDLQKLSFNSNSFDYILSFEVLEHVPHADRATEEMHRCLRPGGRLFLTAPFRHDSQRTTVRAAVSPNGSIEHFLPAEYHGNPTDPVNGALCFRHFGWDYLGYLKSIGFSDVAILRFWSREFGYLGVPTILTAVKN
jgi:SAM-dependent methyltransferase